MTLSVIFILGFAAFLFLLFVGMPFAFAFAVTGFVGLAVIMGIDGALAMLGPAVLQWVGQESLVVIPLFVLMGEFAFYSGVSKDLFAAAYKWMGRLPGGLALGTNLACTAFAACTGSSLASAATMATVAFPEMERLNYDRRLSTGALAAGGTLGILIPPSTVFIIYGVLTNQPIGKLFIAGILPGLLLSGLFLLQILAICTINPKLGPPGAVFTWRQRFASLSGVWGMISLFMLVIGGLYVGIFAPSEAGAIGAFGAFVLCLLRRVKRSALVAALKDSLVITCMILAILMGAMIFNTFVTVTGTPRVLADWVSRLPFPPTGIVVLILLMYIPLGMFMDTIGMILLTVPTFFPIIQTLGFDPIWFGVLIVLVAEMSMISPPVGMVVNVVSSVSKVSLHEVFIGSLPFFLIMCIAMAVLVAFPQISLFLPGVMR